MNLEKEIADLKRRVAELEGSFGYITGQLREVQVFLHNNIDSRLTSLEGKVDALEGKVDAGFAEMRDGFAKFDASFRKLPDTIADAVGQVLRSRE